MLSRNFARVDDADYSANDGDTLIGVVALSAARRVTLPRGLWPSRLVVVRDFTGLAGQFPIHVTGPGGELCAIDQPHGAAWFESDGHQWRLLP